MVTIDEDSNYDRGAWDGQLSSLKRFTEASIKKSQTVIDDKIQRLLETVHDAEARDNTSERELKSRISKLSGNLST